MVQYEVQDSAHNAFVFGLAIDEITSFTTNEKWESFFLDRSDVKNKDCPLKKAISLINFSLLFFPVPGHLAQPMFSNSEKPKLENYLLLPGNGILSKVIATMMVHLSIKQDISAELILNDLTFQVSKQAYDALLALSAHIANCSEVEKEL